MNTEWIKPRSRFVVRAQLNGGGTKVSSFDELTTLSHSSMRLPFKDFLFIDCIYHGVTDPVHAVL